MAISDKLDEIATGSGAGIVGGSTNTSGPGPQIMAADTLKNNDVYNRSNEKLGTIEHIMLDVSHGRIVYAVLARGGVLGIGGKLHAIPWSALTLDANRKCFVVDLDKDQLKASDAFDKDHWPAIADSRWAPDLHAGDGRHPCGEPRSF